MAAQRKGTESLKTMLQYRRYVAKDHRDGGSKKGGEGIYTLLGVFQITVLPEKEGDGIPNARQFAQPMSKEKIGSVTAMGRLQK